MKSGIFAIVLLILLGANAAPAAEPDTELQLSRQAQADTLDFVILPFANHTGKSSTRDLLQDRLHRALQKRGYTAMSSPEIRPTLRDFRIRSRGWIGREDAEILRTETGARFLLLGSWDVIRLGEHPEVGISLRVLDLEHMQILKAVSIGKAGQDSRGFLGRGQIYDIEQLADVVITEALDELLPIPDYAKIRRSFRGCRHLAIIPFNNHSETVYAGEAMANIVLSQLVDAGYFVIEPGFIRELGLKRGVITRGEVDLESANAMLEELGVCRIVTGAVERFDTAAGLNSASVPRVAVGLRSVFSENGVIDLAQELGGKGNAGDSVLGGGKAHALVPLTKAITHDFVGLLVESNRKDILYGRLR